MTETDKTIKWNGFSAVYFVDVYFSFFLSLSPFLLSPHSILQGNCISISFFFRSTFRPIVAPLHVQVVVSWLCPTFGLFGSPHCVLIGIVWLVVWFLLFFASLFHMFSFSPLPISYVGLGLQGMFHVLKICSACSFLLWFFGLGLGFGVQKCVDIYGWTYFDCCESKSMQWNGMEWNLKKKTHIDTMCFLFLLC